MTDPSTAGPVLYTIGHSNHAFADFVALLHQHAITDLVDVRSAPASRYVPHANKRALERTLPDHAIAYHFFGQALGGRPRDPNVYDSEGRIDYPRVMARDWFRSALHDLLALGDRVTAAGGHVAVMCSERDPDRCHRHHLIARALLDPRAGIFAQPPVTVAHILADGTLRPATPADFDTPAQPSLL